MIVCMFHIRCGIAEPVCCLFAHDSVGALRKDFAVADFFWLGPAVLVVCFHYFTVY